MLLLWRAAPKERNPPVLELVSLEPAGIIDNTGAEMRLATLSISNSDVEPIIAKNVLFVEDGGRPIEAKVADDRWVALEQKLGNCALPPGGKVERQILMPAGTDRCRVSLKYTGTSLSKGRAAAIAERLPLFVRSRISHKFWRWAGFPHYRPSLPWREITVELPFPPHMARKGILYESAGVWREGFGLLEGMHRSAALPSCARSESAGASEGRPRQLHNSRPERRLSEAVSKLGRTRFQHWSLRSAVSCCDPRRSHSSKVRRRRLSGVRPSPGRSNVPHSGTQEHNRQLHDEPIRLVTSAAT